MDVNAKTAAGTKAVRSRKRFVRPQRIKMAILRVVVLLGRNSLIDGHENIESSLFRGLQKTPVP
jgi:hypothetical protein